LSIPLQVETVYYDYPVVEVVETNNNAEKAVELKAENEFTWYTFLPLPCPWEPLCV
jgi:hypothetical protein